VSEAIAVVGWGISTPAGSNTTAFWERLCNAESTATPQQFGERPDWEPLTCRIPRASAEDRLELHELRRLPRPQLLAISAADDAVYSVDASIRNRARCSVAVGTFGAGEYSEQQTRQLVASGPRGVSPLGIPLTMTNSTAAHLAIRYGFNGSAITYSTACAAGATAIGEAMWQLRSRRTDVVLAGGVDSLTYLSAMVGFERLGAMSTASNSLTASRPFDVHRDGFVMGEGAAFLLLMRRADADSEGINPHGQILGYGTNCDAHHLLAPREDGMYASECMMAAVKDADLALTDIGHVNAHGTSTVRNDLAEAFAIERVFGGEQPVVTAPKGVTGHMIGGSAAAEVIGTILSCRTGIVPRIAGLTCLDPLVRVDAAIDQSRVVGPGTFGLSNSFGFGGHNVSLVVSA